MDKKIEVGLSLVIFFNIHSMSHTPKLKMSNSSFGSQKELCYGCQIVSRKEASAKMNLKRIPKKSPKTN